MNANDRKLIAKILSGISSGDCVTQVNAGAQMLIDHPKIIEELDAREREWWGVQPLESDSENKLL